MRDRRLWSRPATDLNDVAMLVMPPVSGSSERIGRCHEVVVIVVLVEGGGAEGIDDAGDLAPIVVVVDGGMPEESTTVVMRSE